MVQNKKFKRLLFQSYLSLSKQLIYASSKCCYLAGVNAYQNGRLTNTINNHRVMQRYFQNNCNSFGGLSSSSVSIRSVWRHIPVFMVSCQNNTLNMRVSKQGITENILPHRDLRENTFERKTFFLVE